MSSMLSFNLDSFNTSHGPTSTSKDMVPMVWNCCEDLVREKS